MSKKKELGDAVHVRLFPETEDLLRKAAREDNRPLSNLIRLIVMKWLHEFNRKK